MDAICCEPLASSAALLVTRNRLSLHLREPVAIMRRLWRDSACMPLYHAGRTALLVLPVLLSLSQSPSAYASEVRESVLTNGLKVLLMQVAKAQFVTVHVWYTVISLN